MSQDLRREDCVREGDVRSSEEDHTLRKTFSVRNWMIFLNERAPPPLFLMTTAGLSLIGTGMFYVQGFIDWEKFFWWGLFAELILELTIRVMDDVKDYELDEVVHPERPLPPGLMRYEDVCITIRVVLASLMLLAGLMAQRFNFYLATTFAAQVVYAALVYMEFFLGDWFEHWVFFQALMYQLDIYFGSLFVIALSSALYGWTGFWVGSVGISGFFTYEVCRNLDPSLPPRKGTYLIVYGKWMTFLIVCFTVSAGAIASYAIAFNWFLWPVQSLMLVSLLILFLLPKE